MLAIKDETFEGTFPFVPHYYSANGIDLHFIDEGNGEPIVMVHGNPTWSFYWRNLILGLRDGYRCVAVDHIGCGLSDKPQKYEYSLQRRVDDLVSVVERLDLRKGTLVAHDWGGAIGLGAVQKAFVVFDVRRLDLSGAQEMGARGSRGDSHGLQRPRSETRPRGLRRLGRCRHRARPQRARAPARRQPP